MKQNFKWMIKSMIKIADHLTKQNNNNKNLETEAFYI